VASAVNACPACGADNESRARFCAQCGARFYRQPRYSSGSFGTGPILVVLFAVCAFVVCINRFNEPPPRMMRVGLEVTGEKAQAMFDVLAPDSVPIIVGRLDELVWINATPREVNAVREFTRLITRYDDLPKDQVARIIDSHRSAWTSNRTYRLPRELRGPLFRLLAFDNVDVGVYRTGDGIGVNARPEDQRIIERLVRAICDGRAHAAG